MSIRILHETPDGHLLEVPSHVLGLDKAIKEGAPECDWSGDPRMFLVFNAIKQQYQVWRLCEDGANRLICPAPHMDNRLLRYLGEIDSWRRGADGNVARMDAANVALERRHQEQIAELNNECREILAFAMKRSHVPQYHETKDRYALDYRDSRGKLLTPKG